MISPNSFGEPYLLQKINLSSQEKQPLLPSGIKLDGSLEDQVESLSQTLASAVRDDDLVAAQQKA